MEPDQTGGKVIKNNTAWATFIIVEGFQGYINVETLPKNWKNSKMMKLYQKDWKSYHEMKIIPMDFRQFPPIFRRPQRQNGSFASNLQKTNILDLNLLSIYTIIWKD